MHFLVQKHVLRDRDLLPVGRQRDRGDPVSVRSSGDDLLRFLIRAPKHEVVAGRVNHGGVVHKMQRIS